MAEAGQYKEWLAAARSHDDLSGMTDWRRGAH